MTRTIYGRRLRGREKLAVMEMKPVLRRCRRVAHKYCITVQVRRPPGSCYLPIHMPTCPSCSNRSQIIEIISFFGTPIPVHERMLRPDAEGRVEKVLMSLYCLSGKTGVVLVNTVHTKMWRCIHPGSP